MLTKGEIQTLLDLQNILIRYENNPSLAERLAIMKEMSAKNFAFKLGRIADSESFEHVVYPTLAETEKEYAEKYRQILAITCGDTQPRG